VPTSAADSSRDGDDELNRGGPTGLAHVAKHPPSLLPAGGRERGGRSDRCPARRTVVCRRPTRIPLQRREGSGSCARSERRRSRERDNYDDDEDDYEYQHDGRGAARARPRARRRRKEYSSSCAPAPYSLSRTHSHSQLDSTASRSRSGGRSGSRSRSRSPGPLTPPPTQPASVLRLELAGFRAIWLGFPSEEGGGADVGVGG
jgi:hypothetical protein